MSWKEVLCPDNTKIELLAIRQWSAAGPERPIKADRKLTAAQIATPPPPRRRDADNIFQGIALSRVFRHSQVHKLGGRINGNALKFSSFTFENGAKMICVSQLFRFVINALNVKLGPKFC